MTTAYLGSKETHLCISAQQDTDEIGYIHRKSACGIGHDGVRYSSAPSCGNCKRSKAYKSLQNEKKEREYAWDAVIAVENCDGSYYAALLENAGHFDAQLHRLNRYWIGEVTVRSMIACGRLRSIYFHSFDGHQAFPEARREDCRTFDAVQKFANEYDAQVIYIYFPEAVRWARVFAKYP